MENQVESSRIVRNVASLIGGKLFGDTSLFLFIVLLSRIFGSEGVGQYSFAMALGGFIALFGGFGFYAYTIKTLSRRSDSSEELLERVFSLRLFLSVAIFAVLLALLPFFPIRQETRLIITLIVAYQLIHRLVLGFTAVFIVHGSMNFAVFLDGSFWGAAALAGTVVSLSGGSLRMAITALPFVALVHLFITYGSVTRKYGRLRLVTSPSVLLRVLREAVPYGFSLLLFQIQTRSDVIFLGFYLGAAAVGLYNVAIRTVFLVAYLPHFVGITLFPAASRLFVKSKKDFAELYHKVLNLSILVGFPVAFGSWLIAPDLIDLIFGNTFAESALILRLLAPLLLIASLNRVMSIFLMSSDQEVQRAKSQGIVAFVNVLGNILLIPAYGIKGAAIATLISETLMCLLFGMRLRSVLGWPRVGSRLAISSVAVASFFFPFVLFPSFSIVIVVPASVLLYSLTLVLFKEIRTNEGRLLMSLVTNS